ncbi:MAG: hypothetical protein H7A46_08410 [Verrucomicrobiales bacterium]|nr:hypothetical protein [Verrucomicrobiales bacterium]
MKRILNLLCGGLVAGAAWAGPNTIPVYLNYTTVTNVPQIDALAFANYGIFNVYTYGFTYDFMNVDFYTNRGDFYASPGVVFDHVSDSGERRPSQVFVNEQGATVTAEGDYGISLEQGGRPGALQVYADKVVNHGTLEISSEGVMQLEGGEVDLRRGALSVAPILFGTGFQGTTNYWPDEGITDLFWGISEQAPRIRSSQVMVAFPTTSAGYAPPHIVTNLFGGFTFVGQNAFTLNTPKRFAYTNIVDSTNRTYQVVLVANSDPDMNSQVTFFPSYLPTNAFSTATLQLSAELTNNIIGGMDTVTAYLIDRLASDTNYALVTNMLTGDMPYRPASYEFTRNASWEFAFGDPPNFNGSASNVARLIYNPGAAPVTNVITNLIITALPPTTTNYTLQIITNIVRDLGYSHDVVTNLYAGYGARITNSLNAVPAVPGSSPTNAAGKISVVADTLNLERTRVRGEGTVAFSTRHLVSTKLLSVDVPNVLYTVGATNGFLELANLVTPEVRRFAGDMQAWSGLWTNTWNTVVDSITNTTTTNIVNDPTTGPSITVTNDPGTNAITTNTIQVGIHVMLVDGTGMNTHWPGFITGLGATGTNVYVSDTTRVVETLLVQAENLEVGPKGSLLLGVVGGGTFPNTITDWKVEHFPDLLRLTNEGVISVPGQMILGDDRAVPYERVEIRGTNAAMAHRYRVKNLVNSGYIVASPAITVGTNIYFYQPIGPVELTAEAMTFDGGRIDAGGDLAINADSLKLRHSTNITSRNLYLNATGLLADIGGDAEVLLSGQQGVHLLQKPAQGDLLGTTVALTAPRFQLTRSTWAAEDRGPVAAGFKDNVALGRLTIDPSFDTTVELAGVGTQNGLYVDYLELGPAVMNSLEETLVIEPNLTVYFADANMDFNTLTNAFPGRLHWVSEFAGPNSGMSVALPSGETIWVNRPLRESPIIDSDADGTANGFDLFPFSGVTITDFRVENDKLMLTWRAAAGTTYRVESTGSLPADGWEVIREYHHAGDDVAEVSIEDTLPADATQQFYRVSYTP